MCFFLCKTSLLFTPCFSEVRCGGAGTLRIEGGTREKRPRLFDPRKRDLGVSNEFRLVTREKPSFSLHRAQTSSDWSVTGQSLRLHDCKQRKRCSEATQQTDAHVAGIDLVAGVGCSWAVWSILPNTLTCLDHPHVRGCVVVPAFCWVRSGIVISSAWDWVYCSESMLLDFIHIYIYILQLQTWRIAWVCQTQSFILVLDMGLWFASKLDDSSPERQNPFLEVFSKVQAHYMSHISTCCWYHLLKGQRLRPKEAFV